MKKASDIRNDDWIERRWPQRFRPYARLMRLDRPIGTWLLLFPAWWSLLLASPQGDAPLRLMVLFAIGAFFLRGAGCTINDIVDRDVDRLVARTASRPIASGAVSISGALLFAFLQILVGLGVLVAIGSLLVFKLAFASLGLVLLYPFMKRITFWPQAFLGLAFNWGALLGWAAIKGSLDWPPILLYCGGIFWTLHYDTIYAHQDKVDDRLVGVKSTALLLAHQTKPALTFFALVAVLFWMASAMAAHRGGLFYPFLFLAFLEMLRQTLQVDLDDPRDCLTKFRNNQRIGWILFLGFILG